MWTNNKPQFGSAIRVRRTIYYHYGIYCDDSTVVHFSAKDSDGVLDYKSVKVIVTDLKRFLKDGTLETLEYDDSNRPTRSPVEIVNYAFSMVGTGGYDLVNNNCEHFVYDCLYGKKESKQVDAVKNIFRKF